jgi:hypothetical protein
MQHGLHCKGLSCSMVVGRLLWPCCEPAWLAAGAAAHCACLLLVGCGVTVAWHCCQGFVVQVSLCVCGQGVGACQFFCYVVVGLTDPWCVAERQPEQLAAHHQGCHCQCFDMLWLVSPSGLECGQDTGSGSIACMSHT